VRPSGESIWETALDFPGSDYVSIEAIAQTTDSGYILVGQSYKPPSGYYYYDSRTAAIAVKLRSNGKLQWKRSFSVSSGDVWLRSVASMPDGGFTAGGGVHVPALPVNLFLVRFTSVGDILWAKGFDYPGLDTPLLATPDNGFILASGFSDGARVIKFDYLGNVVWRRLYEAPGFKLQAVKVTSDKGNILAGVSQSRRGRDFNQLSLIQLESDGKIAWKEKYSFQNSTSITDVIQTPDGGYAISGVLIGSDGAGRRKTNALLLKIDPLRKIVFQQTYGSGIGVGSVFATGDSGYVTFSSKRGDTVDTLISKLDPQGIVPGCGSFQPLPSTSISFGELKTRQFNVKEPIRLSLGTSDIAATSVNSTHKVTTVCQ
jgi:hypothetical protein